MLSHSSQKNCDEWGTRSWLEVQWKKNKEGLRLAQPLFCLELMPRPY